MITWNNETSSSRNEIVFEGRHRAYGAYEIRSNYNRTLTYVVGGMIGFFALVWSARAAFYKGPEPVIKNSESNIIVDLTPPKPIEDVIKPELAQPPAQERKLSETLKFTPPEIKDNASDEDQKTQDEVKNTQVGDTDIKDPKGGDDVLPPDDNTGAGTGITETKGSDTYIVVEEMPEFPGGTEEMIKYIQKNLQYPTVARETGLSGKCFLKFVVSETGSISRIEILKGVPGCVECDQEAIRVIKSMPGWKPGKQNGRAVNVYFNLPINFRIQ